MSEQSGKDDRELEIVKEDTAQIFVHFVRLQSHSATVDPQSPGPPAQATAPPASSVQEQHRSQLSETCTHEGSRELSVHPTLTRSKSRDARKETHPKAVHSVVPSRASVQLASNHHCRAINGTSSSTGNANTVDLDPHSSEMIPLPSQTQAAAGANNLSLSPPSASSSPKTGKQRPDKLTLMHKRVPSSHSAAGSDSSGKTTPAQDPPMDPLPLSPVDFASSSFPPMSTNFQLTLSDQAREGLTCSAVHTLPRPSKSTADATSQISCTLSHERVRECRQAPAAAVEGDPRAVKARIIADRLKHIGDDLENQYIKEKLDDITDAIGDVAVMSNNPLQFISYIYTQSDLSWRKVAELFKLFYRVMESSKYDDQFTLFEKAWYGLMDIVVPWIHAQGGWSYYLRATGPGLQTNTPSVVRRNQPLVPALSVPVHLDQSSLPSCAAPLAATPNRAYVVEGRQTLTPQMPRHTTTTPREQNNPSLVRSYTQPQSDVNFVGRNRVWSLNESGNFKNEGSGVEDIEKSISELDMTDNYMVFKEDDEVSEGVFGTSQEEEEEEEVVMGEGEEGRKLQEADRTLTSASLHSGLSLHSSSSSINKLSSSPPIVVPSPHSSSQPETVSTEDFHCDSGIENLSLSCSPLSSKVSFSVGGVNTRHFPMVHACQQTSLTSLSSAASASPIHSPSSRKNSSSNGFNSKSRPRSSGSLKESHPKQGDSPSQCHRTGSLTKRPRPQVTTPTTTNRTSTHSTDSGHSYSFESPIPVRRISMSTSAAVIYELVKDFFGSP